MWWEEKDLLSMSEEQLNEFIESTQKAADSIITDKNNKVSSIEWRSFIIALIDSIKSSVTIAPELPGQSAFSGINYPDLPAIMADIPAAQRICVLKSLRYAFENLSSSFLDPSSNELKDRFIDHYFDAFEINCLNDIKDTYLHPDTYKQAINNLFNPVIIFDQNWISIIHNEAAANLINSISPANSLSDSYPSDLFSTLLQSSITNYNSSLQDDFICTASLATYSGERSYKVHINKVPIENQHLYLVSLEDVTSQLETELNLQTAKDKAEEADKLKTAFLANMSHEIRTPMNAILGFTELMLNEKFENADRIEYLKLIRKSSNDLLNIIEDIIDIAKIESKQMKIRYKPCKPYDILIDLKSVFTETMRRFGINQDVMLLLQVDKEYQALTIYTDGERLKQVISNLLNNAVKFTNHGSISFGFKRIDNNLFFFVSDTGIGIPETMREKIFERFFQLEKTISMNVGGSGLGLAICKNIIHLLGGKIWVNSEEGKGSDFYFQIPAREVSSNTITERDPSPIQEIPDWQGRKFLIAEDDEYNFLLLREMLQKTHVNLIWAKNGVETVNIVESDDKIDLVLMDIKMPEMDGFEATRYITSLRPALPVIAQTAYAMEGDRTRCMNAGCCAYVTKPVERNKLFQLINRHLAPVIKKAKQHSSL